VLLSDVEEGIEEHLAGGLKGDAVLGKILSGLVAVPLEENALGSVLDVTR
jgi:hypothetical protein